MNFKAIVFDLDGTISDPSVGYLNGINYALNALGKESYQHTDYKNYLGTPLHVSFEQHFFKEEPHLVDNAILLFREYYGFKGKFENTLYDGISDLVKTISKTHDLYVLTNKTHSFAIDIIQHFGLSENFKGIYGIDPNSKLCKSDVAKQLNQSVLKNKDNVLMIGDTIHDILCANEVNWKSCYVSYGFGREEDLKNISFYKKINSVQELTSYLTSA